MINIKHESGFIDNLKELEELIDVICSYSMSYYELHLEGEKIHIKTNIDFGHNNYIYWDSIERKFVPEYKAKTKELQRQITYAYLLKTYINESGVLNDKREVHYKNIDFAIAFYSEIVSNIHLFINENNMVNIDLGAVRCANRSDFE
jgi:hypothetical protein